MGVSDPGFLKSVELRLIRCTLYRELPFFPPASPTPPSSSLSSRQSFRPLVEAVVDSIERGRYMDALSSDASRLVFGFSESWEFQDSAACAARFYEEVELSVEAFLRDVGSAAWLQVLDADSDPDVDVEGRCALLMCLGVAALLAFTQQNVTGWSPFAFLIPSFMHSRSWNQVLRLIRGFVNFVGLLGISLLSLWHFHFWRRGLVIAEVSGTCGHVIKWLQLDQMCMGNLRSCRYRTLCFLNVLTKYSLFPDRVSPLLSSFHLTNLHQRVSVFSNYWLWWFYNMNTTYWFLCDMMDSDHQMLKLS